MGLNVSGRTLLYFMFYGVYKLTQMNWTELESQFCWVASTQCTEWQSWTEMLVQLRCMDCTELNCNMSVHFSWADFMKCTKRVHFSSVYSIRSVCAFTVTCLWMIHAWISLSVSNKNNLELVLMKILLIDQSPKINELILIHVCSQSERPWKLQNLATSWYLSQTKAKVMMMMQYINCVVIVHNVPS